MAHKIHKPKKVSIQLKKGWESLTVQRLTGIFEGPKTEDRTENRGPDRK